MPFALWRFDVIFRRLLFSDQLMPRPVSYLKPFLLVILALLLVFTTGWRPTASAQAPNGDQKQRPRKVGDAASTTPADSANKPQTTSGEDVAEGDVVRVDTQLVSVPAVVTNNLGRPLAGLQAGNFVLFENGQPQRLANFATTEAPFEIALLLDTSGS